MSRDIRIENLTIRTAEGTILVDDVSVRFRDAQAIVSDW